MQAEGGKRGIVFRPSRHGGSSSTYIIHSAKLHSEKYVLYAICIDTPRRFFTGELHIRIFRSRSVLLPAAGTNAAGAAYGSTHEISGRTTTTNTETNPGTFTR